MMKNDDKTDEVDNNNAKQPPPPPSSAFTQTPTLPLPQLQPSDDDFVTRTPPNNNRSSYLSPDNNNYFTNEHNSGGNGNGDGVRRILSSHSLVGEDIGGYDDMIEDPTATSPASFHRTTSGITFDADLSPFTPTSQGENNYLGDYDDDDDDNNNNRTNSITPPLSIQKTPASLSPPLFTNYRSSDSIASSSIDKVIHTPTQAQHQRLQPRTTQQQQHLQSSVLLNYTSVSAPNSISGQHSVASAGPPTGGGTGGGGSGTAGGGGRQSFRARPPRAPTTTVQQPSSLPSSPAAAAATATKHRNNTNQLQPQLQPQQQPLLFDGVGRIEQQQQGQHGHHTRVPTDGTNFTFLSALTDFTGDYGGLPRRRTMSWDDTHNNKNTTGGRLGTRTAGGAGAGSRNNTNTTTTSNNRNTTTAANNAGRGATTTITATGSAIGSSSHTNYNSSR